MKTSRPVVASACCLVVATVAGITAWSRSHGASARANKTIGVERIAEFGSADPQITPLASPPGVLQFRAKAQVQAFDMQDRAVWWQLEVRRQQPDGGFQPMLSHDYREQAVAV